MLYNLPMGDERKQWGGRRPGAGRRPVPAPMESRTVSLPPDLIEQLEQLGDGNLSKGIRRAAAAFFRRHGAKQKDEEAD